MNSINTRISAGLHHFFFTPSSGRPLAFLRIGAALLALLQIVLLNSSLLMLYGRHGLVQWLLSEGIISDYALRLGWIAGWLARWNISPDQAVMIVAGIYTVALIALIFGLFTRGAALLSWLIHFMLTSSGFMSSYGVETFTHIALFYCVVMPVGHHFSLDARRHGRPLFSEWYTLSVRVLQLHLCIVYMATGLEKAAGTQWWTGEAIWRALMQMQFGQFDMSWLAHYTWLARLICWGTMLLEISYPLFMFHPRLRRFGYPAIIMLHLGIGLFMGLGLFAAMMITLNTAAFWPFKERETAIAKSHLAGIH
ncbi:MAG TPA: HTTM domain-containing protein [Chitinophaga sp.]|uniref:HTTM domain-containing protein n=1 Tax=Chitinophaga sp. TaxID=1869181 RepID=UPI002C712BCA|nr:HTTM domain-containing protein [Chitinophaga sp.]HVI44657.1 HTTM domain-containing protein [Chitinophaga sp.]